MFPASERDEVVRLAKERYALVYREHAVDHGGCLCWALSVMWVLGVHYKYTDTMIQAGTASWRMRLPENDDGVSPTHFSYVFENMPAVIRFSEGLFPEMHVWLLANVEQGEVEDMELIDLTTGFQPQQMVQLIGDKWDEPLLPPPYYWGRVGDLPDTMSYQAHSNAYKLTSAIAKKLHREHQIAW